MNLSCNYPFPTGIDIERSILLFPMIQDMAKTEKAKSLYTMLTFRYRYYTLTDKNVTHVS